MLREMFLDKRAFIDGTLAPILFVVMNSFFDLTIAAVSAGILGTGLALQRAIQRKPIKQVVYGLIGLGFALALALRSGKASTYFLPGVITGLAMGAAAFISVLAGRPMSSFIARVVEGHPPEHYRRRPYLRAHMLVTTAWAALYVGRSALRAVYIAQDRTEALGVTFLVLGYPATALWLVVSVMYLRRLNRPPVEPVPDTAS